MSYSKQSPYAFAIKEMAYWKDRAQNTSRGAPEPWNESRSYREASYDSGTEDRWQSDRMDTGLRSNPPSLFATRLGSSNLTHLSSSNQANANLFDNFQPRDDRNRGSFSDAYPFRDGDRLRLGRGISNLSRSSGRVVRNPLADSLKIKRILQRGALNTANVQRRPQPRIRPTQIKSKSDTKTEDKDKPSNQPAVVPKEFRLAIVWVNDAKMNINVERAALLVKKLEQLLDEFSPSEDGHIPKFYSSGLSGGIFKLVCVDQKSKDWLIESVANLTDLWEGAKLEIILQSDLKKFSLVTFIITRNDDEIITILKRIEKQNPEVKTTTWRVHREFVEGEKRTIIFSIDDQSLEYLEKNEWKLFLGLKRMTFAKGVPKPVMPKN